MASQPNTSALHRALDPLDSCLTSDFAERLVELRADPELQARLDELAGKSTEGDLSDEERTEYQQYVEAIDFISILQSKARRFLAHNASA